MPFVTVTDRTSADVARLKELKAKIMSRTATASEISEWLGDLKGAYNASDLNRVGADVDYLYTLMQTTPATILSYLESLGVAPDDNFTLPIDLPPALSPKTDWTVYDIPTAIQLATYLGNVLALRDAVGLADPPDMPSSMGMLDYKGANAIEQLLVNINAYLEDGTAEMEDRADRAAATWVFCGQPSCGLVNLQFGG